MKEFFHCTFGILVYDFTDRRLYLIYGLLIDARFLTNIRFGISLLLLSSFRFSELLKDLNVARVKSFLVMLSPFHEFEITFLNESFKLSEDAAAERNVTFSKFLSNEGAIRRPASYPGFS